MTVPKSKKPQKIGTTKNKPALTLKAGTIPPLKKMTSAQLAAHLENEIEKWFADTVIENNKKAIQKLNKASSFEINRYLAPYVSQATTGSITAEGIARGLIQGRAMVTSLNTSFGDRMQIFITNQIKEVVGSAIAGIDIEFEDCIDGQKKYAQVKAGVTTINKDDVEPIVRKFKTIRAKAKRDGVKIAEDQTVICVLYGNESTLNAHYKKLKDEGVEVHVGDDFWERLTGEKDMEKRLFKACLKAAENANVKPLLDKAAAELALDPEIIALVP
jgi:hypothetical protein